MTTGGVMGTHVGDPLGPDGPARVPDCCIHYLRPPVRQYACARPARRGTG